MLVYFSLFRVLKVDTAVTEDTKRLEKFRVENQRKRCAKKRKAGNGEEGHEVESETYVKRPRKLKMSDSSNKAGNRKDDAPERMTKDIETDEQNPSADQFKNLEEKCFSKHEFFLYQHYNPPPPQYYPILSVFFFHTMIYISTNALFSVLVDLYYNNMFFLYTLRTFLITIVACMTTYIPVTFSCPPLTVPSF